MKFQSPHMTVQLLNVNDKSLSSQPVRSAPLVEDDFDDADDAEAFFGCIQLSLFRFSLQCPHKALRTQGRDHVVGGEAMINVFRMQASMWPLSVFSGRDLYI